MLRVGRALGRPDIILEEHHQHSVVRQRGEVLLVIHLHDNWINLLPALAHCTQRKYLPPSRPLPLPGRPPASHLSQTFPWLLGGTRKIYFSLLSKT